MAVGVFNQANDLGACFRAWLGQLLSLRPTGLPKPMDPRSIPGNQVVLWVALAVGLAVALVIGSAVGSADIRFVAGVLAIIPAVVIVVKLKTNIWILLPIGWYFGGTLPWLPVPFSVRNLCFLAVIASFTVFYAMRAVPWKRKSNVSVMDSLIYINLGYLLTVYVRNPAGFWAIQTDIVGGRPYMEIALAFGAFLILSRVQISNAIANVFPLFFVIPAWTVGILDVVGRINPQIGYRLNSLYSGVGPNETFGSTQSEAEVGTTRLIGLQSAGYISILALCARYNPVTLFSPLYPWRTIMLAASLGLIFLSGFRSLILFAVVAFMLSAILHRRLQDLWVAISASFLALIFIIVLQGNFLQLPLTMQRALSWLPADWDAEAVMDAKASTQWRLDMWGWAWNDDRILRDRVWGQGFGFTIEDMNLIVSSLAAGGGSSGLLGGSDREQFMITGTLHSGPLSSIKFIGIVGLTLYYALLSYMSILAWRICKQALGTKAFTLALFVCIPIIYEPFNFVFVFGALEGGYPTTLFRAGLLSMTQWYVQNLSDSLPIETGARFPKPKSSVSQSEGVLRRQR